MDRMQWEREGARYQARIGRRARKSWLQRRIDWVFAEEPLAASHKGFIWAMVGFWASVSVVVMVTLFH